MRQHRSANASASTPSRHAVSIRCLVQKLVISPSVLRRGRRDHPAFSGGNRPFEDKERTAEDQREAHRVVQGQPLAEIEDREEGEHDQRDHLLHGLEFGSAVDGVPPAVGGHGQAIFEEGDAPARQDHQPQRTVGELEVPVPGEGHEDIGEQQQRDGHDGGGQPGHSLYSGLMPSFLISGTTVLSSLASMAASSSGVLDRVSAESSAKRFTTPGSASTFTMASCSLANTSGGILAGPNRPM